MPYKPPAKSRRNKAILTAFAAGATYAGLGRQYGLTKSRIREIVAKEMRTRRIRLGGYSREHCSPARRRALINGEPLPPLPEPLPPLPEPPCPAPSLFDYPALTLREVLDLTKPPAV